jgi:Zn-dependent protease
MADRLGDPTARLQGRLSLNPLRHYDPVGTTLLLVTSVMRAMGMPVMPFGWAKPVQFDPYNLENPRRDAAIISIAGPASNMILAIIFSLILRVGAFANANLFFLIPVLTPIITLNVVLAIFNLIPIHPLDGGKILVGLLPRDLAIEAEDLLRRYGIFILFLLIFPIGNGGNALGSLITPVIRFVLGLLLPAQLQFI